MQNRVGDGRGHRRAWLGLPSRQEISSDGQTDNWGRKGSRVLLILGGGGHRGEGGAPMGGWGRGRS